MIACTLRLYNRIDNIISSFAKTLCLVCRGVSEGLSPSVYILFNHIPTPYRRSSVITHGPVTANVQWYYIPDKKYFVKWELGYSPDVIINPENLKSLPILSMEILNNNETVYDLTDFIGDIKVDSLDNTFPSVAHILGAWSITSSVVVGPYEDFTARMIDTSANSIEVSVCNYDFLAVEATSDSEGENVPEAVAEAVPETVAEAVLEAAVPEADVLEAETVAAPECLAEFTGVTEATEATDTTETTEAHVEEVTPDLTEASSPAT